MIKEGDIVELEYSGFDVESGKVFDTTNQELAKKEGIFNPHFTYQSVLLKVGSKMMLPGIEAFLIGKKEGKHEIILEADDAFGSKNAKLVRMIPMTTFKKHNVKPAVGMQVNVDDAVGLVKSAGGGRVMVDFNHPLAGKKVMYDLTIKKLFTDEKEVVMRILEVSKIEKYDLKDKAITISDESVKDEQKKLVAQHIHALTGSEYTVN